MLADYHMHTSFSEDSDCPMEKMVQQAVAMGLDEIAFTEHVDYGVKTDDNCDYEAYFNELYKIRDQYKDKIRIKAGIEFGVQSHTIHLFEKDYEKYPFDFVILSNHQIEDKEFWNQTYQNGKSQEQFQQAYYEAIYKVVMEYKDYSVLGHLDMIKRYDQYGAYPDEKILDIVEKILSKVIADGKGIEVNTSCYRYGLKDITPSRRILEMYHELGGRIITIGSDAHAAEYVGAHIAEIQNVLREIGFKEICTFEGMKPVYWTL